MSKIIFFGGKGGVGKTSCSSAFAIAKAKKGKVLLVSTDPAHSISDLFNQKIGAEIISLQDNLDGLEIDPQKESDDYINAIKGNMSNIISPIILDEMNKQLDAARVSPGSHESALFDKMIKIIIEGSKHYDYIIFDTAPTGHTIRLLTLPEMLGAWMNTLLKKRRKSLKLRQMVKRIKGESIEEDPIIRILKRRQKHLIQAREIMMDHESLSFIFVMNPERLPIEETKKAVHLLRQYKIPVNNLVINRILPENPVESFWQQKKQHETQYLKEIEEHFKGMHFYKLPLFPNDMHEASIEDMSSYFQ